MSGIHDDASILEVVLFAAGIFGVTAFIICLGDILGVI